MSTDHRQILGHILSNDGATLSVSPDQVAEVERLTDGYMVSRAGLEHTVPLSTFSLRDLDEYIIGATPWLGRDAYIGAWIEDGIVYLDVSDKVSDRDAAIHMGWDRRQKAIFDNARQRVINL